MSAQNDPWTHPAKNLPSGQHNQGHGVVLHFQDIDIVERQVYIVSYIHVYSCFIYSYFMYRMCALG